MRRVHDARDFGAQLGVSFEGSLGIEAENGAQVGIVHEILPKSGRILCDKPRKFPSLVSGKTKGKKGPPLAASRMLNILLLRINLFFASLCLSFHSSNPSWRIACSRNARSRQETCSNGGDVEWAWAACLFV